MPDIFVSARINPDFDPEIAAFLENIPRRKRSELVRKLLRQEALLHKVHNVTQLPNRPIATLKPVVDDSDEIIYAPAEDVP